MFKSLLRNCLLLLAGAAVVGCATTGPEIRTEAVVSARANLQGYKTYAWLAGIGVLEDPDHRWKPVGFDAHSEIQFLVDKELRKRGLTQVEETPSAYVAYTILAHTDMNKEQIKKWFGDTADMSNKEAGALIVVLLDGETQKVIWAGMAKSQAKKGRSSDEAKARLGIAVEKIFSHYHSSN